MATWKTKTDEEILYENLTDVHLKNIIKDGYRNQYLIEEAQKRNIPVPVRKIDELKYIDILQWIESFASCAIEGNKLGEVMLKLWDKNPELFLFHLNQLLEKVDKEK